MLRWLYIDCNSFFASCEQQENPTLRGKPIAVVPVLADTTSCIAASYEAKKFGIKTGTSVRLAKRLCPELVLVKTQHSLYIDYHQKIVSAIAQCVPIEMVCSIDEVACKLTGSQQQIEPAIHLAQGIKNSIENRVGRYLSCSIGLAPNRFLAKVAADMQKPDGLTLIQKSELPHKLYSLALDDLPGIGHRMRNQLYRCGITRVDQLCGLDKAHMRSVWKNIWGERMWLWLKGEECELPATRASSLSHQHVLAPALRNTAAAYAVAQQLLNKAALRLREKACYAKRLSLSIKFSRQCQPRYWEDSLDLGEICDTPSLLQALTQLWQTYPFHLIPWRVSVILSNLIPTHAHQLSFFEQSRLQKVSHLMDQINHRFGKNVLRLGNIFRGEEFISFFNGKRSKNQED